MKPIKFRAWHKKNRKMLANIYSFTCYDNTNGSITGIMETDYEDLQYPEEVELMQFTGLTDKNGVEIYEGDIVILQLFKDRTILGKIEYYAPSFILMPCDNSELPYGITNMSNLEIIGNIYKNPDLLEKTQEAI